MKEYFSGTSGGARRLNNKDDTQLSIPKENRQIELSSPALTKLGAGLIFKSLASTTAAIGACYAFAAFFSPHA